MITFRANGTILMRLEGKESIPLPGRRWTVKEGKLTQVVRNAYVDLPGRIVEEWKQWLARRVLE